MRKIRQKTINYLILEKTKEIGLACLDVFFPPQYSFTKPSRILFGLDRHPKKEASIQTFRSVISRLKKQELITTIKTETGPGWKITDKGRGWLAKRSSYVPPEPDGTSRLVVFDIPEKERRKRNMIRAELLACGFKPLQKSVWIGEVPLPIDFLDVLDKFKLKNKVHIFSIKEKGTITEENL